MAAADIDMFGCLDSVRLGAGLSGDASYRTVAEARLPAAQLLDIMSSRASAEGQARAATALHALSAASGGLGRISLSTLLDPGPYGDQNRVAGGTRARVALPVLNMARAVLDASNQGRRLQVDLKAAAPSLADAQAFVAIGQDAAKTPWLRVTADKSLIIHTAQTRLYLSVKTLPGLVSGLTGVALDTSLYVEAAPAEAQLTQISCAAAGDKVGVQARSGVGRLALAKTDPSKLADFTAQPVLSPVVLAQTPVVSLSAYADTTIGGAAWRSLTFTRSDVDAGRSQRVSSQDIAQASVASLFGNLTVDVKLLGLGIGLGGVGASAKGVLTGLAPVLDQTLNGLTSALGVSLGYADVSATGLRCGVPALVA